jgi:hypothetical protein
VNAKPYLVLERCHSEEDAPPDETWRIVAVVDAADEEEAVALGAGADAVLDDMKASPQRATGVYKALPWTEREHRPEPARVHGVPALG